MKSEQGSRDIARAAIRTSLTQDRQQEKDLQSDLAEFGVQTAAVDFGGEFVPSVMKIIERTVVAARREGLIGNTHAEEGAVAGAAREAVSEISQKAIGLNVGGKIGIARCGEHVAVCVFFGIGMLNLDEVAIGLGHRVI